MLQLGCAWQVLHLWAWSVLHEVCFCPAALSNRSRFLNCMPGLLDAVGADLLHHLFGCSTCHGDSFVGLKRCDTDSLANFEKPEPEPATASMPQTSSLTTCT